ncbi:MAG: Rrf2 family transcriptional regulator [Desulfovibrionaceae bacterium]
MKFSTRTRYGLRFLVYLANAPVDNLVQLAEVANKEGISRGYLEQIVRDLKPMDILHTTRGVGGGYRLSCPPAQINLEQVFDHLEGGLAPVACLSDEKKCSRQCACTTRPFWQALDAHMRSFLQGMTLEQLIHTYNCK